MLKNMKIGVKLTAGFCAVALITLLVGGIGWYAMRTLAGVIDQITDEKIPEMENLRILDREILVIERASRTLLNPLLSDKQYQQQFEDIAAARQRYKKAWEAYEAVGKTGDESNLWKQFLTALEEGKKENDKFFALVKEFEAISIRNPEQLMKTMQEIRGDIWKLRSVLTALVEQNRQFEGDDWFSLQKIDDVAQLVSNNADLAKKVNDLKPVAQEMLKAADQIQSTARQGLFDSARKIFTEEFYPASDHLIEQMRPVRQESEKALKLYHQLNDQLLVNTLPKQEVVRTRIAELLEATRRDMESSHEQLEKTERRATAGQTTAVFFGVVLALAMGTLITRAITKPIAKGIAFVKQVAQGDVSATLDIDQKDEIGMLAASMNTMVANLRELVKTAERIAEGDLTVNVKPLSEKDALGNALKHMVERLSNVVAEINTSSSNVAAGAEQMSSTSQAMSQGATEQASALEEISSSMNQIASQTKQNAENASHASKLAGEAKDYAARGNQQVGEMVGAMKEISESSRNIQKIIKVIDEIAFQTNLLALNAAVEAARAGKHGKGFAVVAEEVRNLAARSAKAAKETAEMIEGAVKKIEDGTAMADRTAAALSEIVTAATKVTDLVAEIAAASNEQAQGVSQITQGLSQIDQVTQQNTAHAEESASAAEELSSQAMVLQQLIGTFKVSGQVQQVPSAGMLGTAAKKGAAAPKKAVTSGWGHPQDTAHQSEPEPVIHLDDSEFGKF